jgi:LPPG:FO 2-phospho-L-lactate transferase
LTIICNTADDCYFYGLYISPDVDSVLYSLSGLLDEEKWWGIKDDTFNCLDMLKKYGYDTWFELGDRDLVLHIHRTRLLKEGYLLSEVIKNISMRLNIKANVLPMSDQKVTTMVLTNKGKLNFQEFWVKERAKVKVESIEFEGIQTAEPSYGVIDHILENEVVIIGPSNPVTSIRPILEIKGIKNALKNSKSLKIAISPIIGEKPLSGPAGQLMKTQDLEVSPYSIAKMYSDFLDVLFIHDTDKRFVSQIEDLGISAFPTNIIMNTSQDKINLAQDILDLTEARRC